MPSSHTRSSGVGERVNPVGPREVAGSLMIIPLSDGRTVI